MSVYTDPLDKVIDSFGSNSDGGLSESQATKNLEKYGENVLKAQKHRTFFQKFVDQLKDYMVIILIIAAIISFVIALVEKEGTFIDSIIILAIVIFNAVLGVIQESGAEKALDALKSMSAPFASVIRGGSRKKVPSTDVVPGDIILLEAGDLIPADARLIECASLKSEESALTGESVPVDKDINVFIEDDAPLGDRLNMVYSGCSVSYGRGKAIVTSTGMDTEMGKIAGLLNREVAENTPLQERLNRLGKNLGIICIVICVAIFLLGIFQQREPVEMFMTAVSLAVAAIPEGLATVVTLVLAMGVQEMVKQNAIIRRLPAVETLGSTSVICSDKTGTLTQNKMTVMQVWAAGGQLEDMGSDLSKSAVDVLKYNILCNDGEVKVVDGKHKHLGDPTETALVAAGISVGLNKENLETSYPRQGEIPFDSERKLMTTIHNIDGEYIAIIKGGYDVMLPLCTSGDTSMADEINLEMGTKALRVLAVGYKKLSDIPSEITPDVLENNLTFMGLVGMIDPPREESKEAIEVCKKAGIKTVMITGDHVVTATAIAKELGILEREDEAVTGRQLAQMSDSELKNSVKNYSVYARVSPEDKIRIVKAWQSNDEVVAMTGDGVNDAPALKAADIGCAMGITGTDVAKGAADMVLTDDNFSTIVKSVKMGRTIYDNIKKTIEFLLGSNIGEIITFLVAMLAGWGSPLLAIQVLMINVVTDALPAFALGFEKGEKDIMYRKPIHKSESIFSGGMTGQIAFKGIVIATLTLIAFRLGTVMQISSGIAPSTSVGQTMAFIVLAISELVYAYNSRSRYSLFKIGFFSNKRMNQAFLISLAVVLLVTLVPPLEVIFKIHPLSLNHWLIVIVLSVMPILIGEISKALQNKKVEN